MLPQQRARLQGQLLQVHHRDASASRTPRRTRTSASSRRSTHRVGWLRTGARMRPDPPRRRPQQRRLVPRGAAPASFRHGWTHPDHGQAPGPGRDRCDVRASPRASRASAPWSGTSWIALRLSADEVVTEEARAAAEECRPRRGEGRPRAGRGHRRGAYVVVPVRHDGGQRRGSHRRSRSTRRRPTTADALAQGSDWGS